MRLATVFWQTKVGIGFSDLKNASVAPWPKLWQKLKKMSAPKIWFQLCYDHPPRKRVNLCAPTSWSTIGVDPKVSPRILTLDQPKVNSMFTTYWVNPGLTLSYTGLTLNQPWIYPRSTVVWHKVQNEELRIDSIINWGPTQSKLRVGPGSTQRLPWVNFGSTKGQGQVRVISRSTQNWPTKVGPGFTLKIYNRPIQGWLWVNPVLTQGLPSVRPLKIFRVNLGPTLGWPWIDP